MGTQEFSHDLYESQPAPKAGTVLVSGGKQYLLGAVEEKDGVLTFTAKTADRMRVEQAAADALKSDERKWGDVSRKLAEMKSVYEVIGRGMSGQVELVWRGPASSSSQAEYEAIKADARFAELRREASALYDARNPLRWCELLRMNEFSPDSTCVLESATVTGSAEVQPPDIVDTKNSKSGPLGSMLRFLGSCGVTRVAMIVLKGDREMASVDLLETGEIKYHTRRL